MDYFVSIGTISKEIVKSEQTDQNQFLVRKTFYLARYLHDWNRLLSKATLQSSNILFRSEHCRLKLPFKPTNQNQKKYPFRSFYVVKNVSVKGNTALVQPKLTFCCFFCLYTLATYCFRVYHLKLIELDIGLYIYK